MKIKNMTLIAAAAALIAVCSWISVPSAVPFTMQTFAVFFSIGLLGGKRGSLAILIYILMGTVGVPVFSGFLAAALIVWGITAVFGSKTPVLAAAMAIGMIADYVFGSAWLAWVYIRGGNAIGFISVLTSCVIPFIIPDAVKISPALLLAVRIRKAVGREL